MEKIVFDFSGLKSLYLEAENSPDKSLAFELKLGKGRFLFMMFLSSDDRNSKDMLYIYFRRTNFFLHLKTYGSHKNGVFQVYLSPEVQKRFMDELDIKPGANKFNIEEFLNELNKRIPESVRMEVKIDLLREQKGNLSDVIDESEKTVLIGPKHLKKGKPREKTLRKLYMFQSESVNEITEFINKLKEKNFTVAWTTPKSGISSAKLSDFKKILGMK